MYIADWTRFRNLPAGTIFQLISQDEGSLGEISILGDKTTSSDYSYASLVPEVNSAYVLSEEEKIDLDLTGSERIVFTPTGFGRYGSYDCESRHWLIWEEKDRCRLASWLLTPSGAMDEMNDVPAVYVVPSPR